MPDWIFTADVEGAAEEWVIHATEEIAHAMRETAPLGKGPGAGSGRDSIQAEPHGLEGDVTGLKHMLYVETGTRAHPIDAHGAYSLHDPVSGDYFGPHVNHPGTSPNHYIDRAVEQVLPSIEGELLDGIIARIHISGSD